MRVGPAATRGGGGAQRGEGRRSKGAHEGRRAEGGGDPKRPVAGPTAYASPPYRPGRGLGPSGVRGSADGTREGLSKNNMARHQRVADRHENFY